MTDHHTAASPRPHAFHRRSLLGVAGAGAAAAMASASAAHAGPGVQPAAPATPPAGGSGFGAGHRARLAFLKGILQQEDRPSFGMALGDSITEGLGLDDWQRRYQTQLQTLLRAAHPAANRCPGIGYVPAVWGAHGWMLEATTTDGTPAMDSTGLGQPARSAHGGTARHVARHGVRHHLAALLAGPGVSGDVRGPGRRTPDDDRDHRR